jgi:hypothetical protein
MVQTAPGVGETTPIFHRVPAATDAIVTPPSTAVTGAGRPFPISNVAPIPMAEAITPKSEDQIKTPTNELFIIIVYVFVP